MNSTLIDGLNDDKTRYRNSLENAKKDHSSLWSKAKQIFCFCRQKPSDVSETNKAALYFSKEIQFNPSTYSLENPRSEKSKQVESSAKIKQQKDSEIESKKSNRCCNPFKNRTWAGVMLLGVGIGFSVAALVTACIFTAGLAVIIPLAVVGATAAVAGTICLRPKDGEAQSKKHKNDDVANIFLYDMFGPMSSAINNLKTNN